MAESVYKVIELVGTSTESWEKAAAGGGQAGGGRTLREPPCGGSLTARHAVEGWQGRGLSAKVQSLLQALVRQRAQIIYRLRT